MEGKQWLHCCPLSSLLQVYSPKPHNPQDYAFVGLSHPQSGLGFRMAPGLMQLRASARSLALSGPLGQAALWDLGAVMTGNTHLPPKTNCGHMTFSIHGFPIKSRFRISPVCQVLDVWVVNVEINTGPEVQSGSSIFQSMRLTWDTG